MKKLLKTISVIAILEIKLILTTGCGKIKLICNDLIKLNTSISGDESSEILDKICSILWRGRK